MSQNAENIKCRDRDVNSEIASKDSDRDTKPELPAKTVIESWTVNIPDYENESVEAEFSHCPNESKKVEGISIVEVKLWNVGSLIPIHLALLAQY